MLAKAVEERGAEVVLGIARGSAGDERVGQNVEIQDHVGAIGIAVEALEDEVDRPERREEILRGRRDGGDVGGGGGFRFPGLNVLVEGFLSGMEEESSQSRVEGLEERARDASDFALFPDQRAFGVGARVVVAVRL